MKERFLIDFLTSTYVNSVGAYKYLDDNETELYKSILAAMSKDFSVFMDMYDFKKGKFKPQFLPDRHK